MKSWILLPKRRRIESIEFVVPESRRLPPQRRNQRRERSFLGCRFSSKRLAAASNGAGVPYRPRPFLNNPSDLLMERTLTRQVYLLESVRWASESLVAMLMDD